MKRIRSTKASKIIDRLYKENKCQDCTVVVTRMDFAKILGKFTKVKIQYESSKTPAKTKQKPATEIPSPNSNARLKSKENGMVLIHRNAYKPHPVKELLSPKNKKPTRNTRTPIKSLQKTNNVLKENNRLKKGPATVKGSKGTSNGFSKVKDETSPEKTKFTTIKHYGIVFVNPKRKTSEAKSNISLSQLLPTFKQLELPSDEWCIEYIPSSAAPKDDAVYDRIAAELEDLMYNEKDNTVSVEKTETKMEEFPSILDILNDNHTSNMDKPSEEESVADVKSSLASSDIEAMLLGEPNSNQEKVDINEDLLNPLSNAVEEENPASPSILEEVMPESSMVLQEKTVDNVLPSEPNLETKVSDSKLTEHSMDVDPKDTTDIKTRTRSASKVQPKPNLVLPKANPATHVIFKLMRDNSCYRMVTCPKTLKYSLEFEGKSVELLGAPKHVSSLEDIQVLLQIVQESELESFYVLQ